MRYVVLHVQKYRTARFMRRTWHDVFERVDLTNHTSRKTLRLVVGVRVH